MESYQLEDLSLFNGDLLSVGLTPASLSAPDVEDLSSPDDGSSLLGQLQDGSLWPQLTLTDNTVKATPNSTSDSLITELLGSNNTAVQGQTDLLGSDWLDTRVDLMDYLDGGSSITDNQVELVAVEVPPPTTSSPVPSSPQSPSSVEPNVTQLLEHFGQSQQSVQQLSAVSTPVPSRVDSPVHIQDTSSKEVTGGEQAVDMIEVLSKLTEAMDGNFEDVLKQPSLELPYEPILSPMSAEEVESILSEPTSPGSSSVLEDSGFGEDPLVETVDVAQLESAPQPRSAGPQRQGREKSRSAPYTKTTKESKNMERKLRKKQQNKDAALRYRLKKKAESDTTQTECEKLESRNKELRDKVDSMTREINYLKSLMAEVYKAKGLIKTTKK